MTERWRSILSAACLRTDSRNAISVLICGGEATSGAVFPQWRSSHGHCLLTKSLVRLRRRGFALGCSAAVTSRVVFVEPIAVMPGRCSAIGTDAGDAKVSMRRTVRPGVCLPSNERDCLWGSWHVASGRVRDSGCRGATTGIGWRQVGFQFVRPNSSELWLTRGSSLF